MKQNLKEIQNEIIILTSVFFTLTTHYIYSDYKYLYFLLSTPNVWDWGVFISFLPILINLVLIFLILRKSKLAWIIILLESILIISNAVNGYFIELQLPTHEVSENPSALEELLEIMDPRLGFWYYFVPFIIYTSILIFISRKRVRNLFQISNK